MQVVGELRDAAERLDETVAELERVGGGEADPLDAWQARNVMNERSEVDPLAIGHRAAVSVDVLAKERHLGDALAGELTHLAQNGVEGTAYFLATGVRDDAEAAVLAAAFHDRNVGARAFGTRWRQMIELLDLGEADIDHGATVKEQLLDHVLQPVQCLRAEYQIDERRALDDGRPLLARNTAAHADDDLGPAGLQATPLAKQREHLLLRLLAHRAGVHQQHIRLVRIFGGSEPHVIAQYVRHACGVVLVHLAAEGLDEVMAGHENQNSKACRCGAHGRSRDLQTQIEKISLLSNLDGSLMTGSDRDARRPSATAAAHRRLTRTPGPVPVPRTYPCCVAAGVSGSLLHRSASAYSRALAWRDAP